MKKKITLIVIFILAALATAITYVVSDLKPKAEAQMVLNHPMFIANDSIPLPPKDTLARQHEISFQAPQLLDSLNQIYLFAVGHVVLENEELIQNGEVVHIVEEEKHYDKLSSFKSARYSVNQGQLNNLVLYDDLQEKSRVLFKKKTLIDHYNYFQINNHRYLLIQAVQHDHNKDQTLSNSDLQSLFLYDFQNGQKYLISKAGYSFDHITWMDGQEKIFILGTKDKNSNGSVSGNEPVHPFTYDLKEHQLKPVLTLKQHEELQGSVDH